VHAIEMSPKGALMLVPLTVMLDAGYEPNKLLDKEVMRGQFDAGGPVNAGL